MGFGMNVAIELMTSSANTHVTVRSIPYPSTTALYVTFGFNGCAVPLFWLIGLDQEDHD